jgi:hypothetical protein
VSSKLTPSIVTDSTPLGRSLIDATLKYSTCKPSATDSKRPRSMLNVEGLKQLTRIRDCDEKSPLYRFLIKNPSTSPTRISIIFKFGKTASKLAWELRIALEIVLNIVFGFAIGNLISRC